MSTKKLWNTVVFISVLSLFIFVGSDKSIGQEEDFQKSYLPIVLNEFDADSTGQEPGEEKRHSYDDYELAEQARKRNAPRVERTFEDVRVSGPANQVGQWGPVKTWPFVFASVGHMPDGRLIAWGADQRTEFDGGTETYTGIWDPVTDQIDEFYYQDHTMFCGLPMMRENGDLFVVGGDEGGTPNATSLFHFETETWERIEDTASGRWYNGPVQMPNGDVFIALGTPPQYRYPERWTEGQGWTTLTGIDLQSVLNSNAVLRPEWFPMMVLAPNGQILHLGPTPAMHWINPAGNGSITPAGAAINGWDPENQAGTMVMYRKGKVLTIGGLSGGSNKANIVDISGSTPQVTAVQNMIQPRLHANGVIMPNGEIFFVGGSHSGGWFNDDESIYTPEIWNPDTQSWRGVADHVKPRNYHSVAILMQDGRIFSGGGGLCNCSADHPDHQIYSPPYLFDSNGSLATRPEITFAPNISGYGETISVETSENIDRFTMIKMHGTTHAYATDLRFLEVTFSGSNNVYDLQLESNQNVMTPGYWMLFALNNQGVPSLAHVLHVRSSTPTATTPGPNRFAKIVAESEVNGGSTAAIAELNLLDANDNVIDRSGWSVTPSSEGTNNLADLAIDGTNGTFWQSQSSYPHELIVDLGVGYDLSGLRYLARQNSATGRIAQYKIYLSSDGVNWGSPVAQGTFPNNGAEQTVLFGSGNSEFTIDPIVTTPEEVGATVNYSAVVNGGINLRYKWLFGDGTPETGWSTSPNISHTFSQPGYYTVRLTVEGDPSESETLDFYQAIHLTPTTNRPTASMSIVYQERSGDDRVWNVNPDNDTVSVINAATNQKIAEIAVGDEPRSLAIAPDGRVWVANRGSATISVINSSFVVAQTINLNQGTQPYGVVFAPDGSAAFVSLGATGDLLKLNPTLGTQLGSLSLGQHIRHMSISGDSSTVYVSQFISPPADGEDTGSVNVNTADGKVFVVNAGAMTLNTTIDLNHSNASDSDTSSRGMPNYLGGPAISPDGSFAWVPSKQDNIARGDLRDSSSLNFQNTVRSISSYVDLQTNSETLNKRIDHNNSGIANAAVFGKFGNYLFVSLEGSREVSVVDAYLGTEIFKVDVERAPQGLAISPDGKTLYVHNFLSRSVRVIDFSALIDIGSWSGTIDATVDVVASESLSSQVLRGKELFTDAKDTRLAKDNYLSCASCHNAGDDDGRTWDFTDSGEGLRNTISLVGHANQGMLHWSGNFDEVHDFENQIRSLAGGSGLLSQNDFNSTQNPLGPIKGGINSDLDALAAYVNSLTAVSDSPYRQGDGSLTTAGEAGKQLFVAQGCASCHGGDEFTDSATGNRHDVGTIKSSSGQRSGSTLDGLDTPTLRGLWLTAPYLHDGSAATLADAVNAHTGISLSGADLDNLVSFLQQIDEREPAPPNPPTSPLQLETHDLTAVDGNWQTVNLINTYDSPVIVCTPYYQSNNVPIVVRLDNVTSTAFNIKLQNPGDLATPINDKVSCLVVEEGVWTLPDGTKLEAVKFASTVTAENNNWQYETQSYGQSYTNPVVLGQVMSHNDAKWSVFWSRGLGQNTAPSSSILRMGLHVASDTDVVRASETIGYVVFETGSGNLEGTAFQAFVGPKTISGIGSTTDFYTYPTSLSGTPAGAVAAQAGMAGTDGGWAYVVGANPLSSTTIDLLIDEDQVGDSERGHVDEHVSVLVWESRLHYGAGTPPPPPPPSAELQLETHDLAAVNDTWQTVDLINTYENPVIVCTPYYQNNLVPIVVRLNNVTGDNFDIKLQNPGDLVTPVYDKVSCLIVEAGVWTLPDGTKLEAQKFASTVTAENNSWQYETRNYGQSYTSPVVLGQVMSHNDAKWSAFWSRGLGQNTAPDSSVLRVGLHVASDTDVLRASETIGYVVFESGSGVADGTAFQAFVGPKTISGVGATTDFYSYPSSFGSTPSGAIAIQAGMAGYDGGWAYVVGSNPLSSTAINLLIDEDQIGDGERWHVDEHVAVLVYESQLHIGDGTPPPPPPSGDLALETADITSVSGSWQTVNLTQSYTNPVIVCAPSLENTTSPPIVIRLDNVTGSSFDIKLQNPGDLATPVADKVSCLIVEEGVWTLPDGTKLEAQQFSTSTIATTSNWQYTSQIYGQVYTAPVVIGQVMSHNDAKWSVFWGRGSSQAVAPDSGNLNVGLMVGADNDSTRAAETIGFIVIESGSGTLNGVAFQAFVGPDTISGQSATTEFYTFPTPFGSVPAGAVVTQAAMQGTDGGWANLIGPSPLTATTINLIIDEDQIGDNERWHVDEPVAVFVWETPLSYSDP